MPTNLEKYLKEERNRLDVEFPDDEAIWGRIKEKSTDNRSKKGLRISQNSSALNFWKIAAIVTIIVSLGYITFDIIQDDKIYRRAVLAGISEELGNQEIDYIHAVSLKRKEIKSIDIPNNDIITTLFEELKLQDDLLEEASSDVEFMGDSDQVINTIFNIYERKIDLLERIIIETNKSNNYEKNSEIIL